MCDNTEGQGQKKVNMHKYTLNEVLSQI